MAPNPDPSHVHIARAYDPPGETDGQRVLVDRVWPRGRSRTALGIVDWVPAVAPSTDLRRWFGHDVARWPEFRRRYRAELSSGEAAAALDSLAAGAADGSVTLVYGASDREHNQAVVLAEALAERLARHR